MPLYNQLDFITNMLHGSPWKCPSRITLIFHPSRRDSPASIFIATSCRESRGRDSGWDSDDEDLKRGLAKQDSIEFTRAKMEKKKADRKIEQLRELACRADVDSVIDENSKVSLTPMSRLIYPPLPLPILTTR